MHRSRRTRIAIVIAALAAAVVSCAAAFRASDATSAFPRISPATARAGAAVQQLRYGSYSLTIAVRPNRSTALNRISVRVTRAGRPVAGARVAVDVSMLEMAMPGVHERLRPGANGRYVNSETVLGMVGRWGLRISIAPPQSKRFSIRLVDRVSP